MSDVNLESLELDVKSSIFVKGDTSVETADCKDWLLKQEKDSAQLAFADPPFNIGQSYAEFDDKTTDIEMWSFTNLWVSRLWETVAPGGVMVLYHPVKMQRFVWNALNLYEISRYHENTIIAHFNFGQHQDTDFINAHCQAVVIRKPGERKFRPDGILVESERLKMGDKRVLKSARKGMRVPGNVISDKREDYCEEPPVAGHVISSPRVQGNNKERWNIKNGALVDHPNQLPLSFLKTLVSAYTDEGDSVIEPFTGSGGLALACDKMNRAYRGCEIGPATALSAAKRVTHGHWA